MITPSHRQARYDYKESFVGECNFERGSKNEALFRVENQREIRLRRQARNSDSSESPPLASLPSIVLYPRLPRAEATFGVSRHGGSVFPRKREPYGRTELNNKKDRLNRSEQFRKRSEVKRSEGNDPRRERVKGSRRVGERHGRAGRLRDASR